MIDRGATVLKSMLFLFFHTRYALVGMQVSKSTGVVNLLDTIKENNGARTRVLPKPVMPFTKKAARTTKNKYRFSINGYYLHFLP